MPTELPDASAQMSAWSNYRSRMRDTISLLNEDLEDAGDAATRDRIIGLIERHNGYLLRADKRIAELSG